MNDCKSSPERCVFCLDQKRSPVRVQCGHSFCCGCLDVYKSYKKFPWATKCPICRNVLRENKKSMKRKYSDRNVETNNVTTTITTMTETQNNSSHLENPTDNSHQAYILEEFMSLANYFDDTRGSEDDDDDDGDDDDDNFDNYFHDYEQIAEAVQYAIHDSESHHDADYEAQSTDMDFVDSYEEELNFSIDSDDDSQYYYDDDNVGDAPDYDDHDDDDDDQNNHHFNAVDDFDEPPSSRRHMDSCYYDSYEETTSFIDVEDDGAFYEVDNVDIDWETVIASDVIIIE